MINDGTIKSTGNTALSTLDKSRIANHGTVNPGGTLTMSTKTVENGGFHCGVLNLKTCGVGTLSAEKLELHASHNYASEIGGTQKCKAIQVGFFSKRSAKGDNNDSIDNSDASQPFINPFDYLTFN